MINPAMTKIGVHDVKSSNLIKIFRCNIGLELHTYKGPFIGLSTGWAEFLQALFERVGLA